MWWNLDAGIKNAAHKLIVEHEAYAKSVFEENERRTRRGVSPPKELPLLRPETWDHAPGFNPYLVRARHSRIAHSITNRLRDRSYEPFPPAGFEVPKLGGGLRVVSTFQIADEVISNQLLRSLSRKNLPRLSARAYAYRPDRGPHDAIGYISTEFAREHRLFVAEYDFSKFFDAVSHEYLLELFDRLKINRTPLEQFIIEQFLGSPEPTAVECYPADATRARVRGIPQGTSVSLFLANLAASELDRALERLGVGFVRYADDTLIWSSDYGRITGAASALHEAAMRIGSRINTDKSEGVRLLVGEPGQAAELPSTTHVDFLGHRISLRNTQMKSGSLERIKRRVNHLIYTNLLLEPLAGNQDSRRLTNVDRDYVTLIWQLRRYLYGSLSEADVRRFQAGAIPPMSFQGVMSFFPLVDDNEQLLELDSWIVSQIWLALRKRKKLLTLTGIATPSPHDLSKEALIGLFVESDSTGQTVDLRVPSVRRIAKVLQLAVATYGLGVVSGQAPLYLYDDE